uniref:Uncharacterized protein n=1 Tax=Sus scrofa TaxID=9823 RepID=A0A287AZ03_PIG
MSPYAASTVCESSVSLFTIPAVAFAGVYSPNRSPFSPSLSLSLFLSVSLFPASPSPPHPPTSPNSFSFSEIKRLLTSSRLMEPFFPQRNPGYDSFFWSATQSTEENAQIYKIN